MHDVKEVLSALERVVARYGPTTLYENRDPLYNESGSCRYVGHDGKPLCLIAVVMIEEFGMSPEWFAQAGRNYSVTPVTTEFKEEGQLTREAGLVLVEAQFFQDARATWGEALDRAYSHARGSGWID